ncbi:hypothetical protein [Buchananella hordeovulneris]|uniref:hypothetical protein n=1 Tax=Buchananella hordeovulneris TaxID=52770 RepID=UPI000F5E5A97|nr:hypothetical protein [Buchananella hordeovulneris]MDO5080704.1 hypothetical protein [Buchananella hordeovulneris]RRD42362.1 hypothetical protein EII13_09810 [Buchananella hordeovulneris]
MLRHLVITELQSLRRLSLSVLSAATLIVGLSLVPIAWGVPILKVLGSVAVVLISLGIAVGCTFYLVYRYWQTMHKAPAYFTHTLPVRGGTIFAVKMLVAIAYQLAAIAVSAVFLWALHLAQGVAAGRGLGEVMRADWQALTDVLQLASWPVTVLLALSLLLSVVSMIVQVLATLSLFTRPRFASLGVAAPVVGVVLLYLANQIIGAAATLWIPLGMRVSGPDAGTVVAQGMWSDIVAALRYGTEPQVVGLGSVVAGLLLTILLWQLGRRTIDRHLAL